MGEHALHSMARDDMWFIAVCECGWESPRAPDPIRASNFWGQHLVEIQGHEVELLARALTEAWWQDTGELLRLQEIERAAREHIDATGSKYISSKQRLRRALAQREHERIPVTESDGGDR